MRKAPVRLQELRRHIDQQAQSEATHRCGGLFVHGPKLATLHAAARVATRKGGAAGLDGPTLEASAQAGRWRLLAALPQALGSGRDQPHANRRVAIPPGKGTARTLQRPGLRARVGPGALKRRRAALCEVDGCEHAAGERPGRSPRQALAPIRRSVWRRMGMGIDVD
jgi:hypothetical protein